MKKLRFIESEEVSEHEEMLLNSIKEALFELAKLEDQFPGLREVKPEEIELIAQKIFENATEEDLFLLQKVNEDVVGLCGLVSKFTQRVSSAIRHQNSSAVIPHFEAFSSQESTVKSESKLVYRGVRLDKLRSLLGFYLLVSQQNDEPAFDRLLEKLAQGEAFSLDLIKNELDHEVQGSHYWQLWKFTADFIKSNTRTQPDFLAGVQALAEAASRKRKQTAFTAHFWQPKAPVPQEQREPKSEGEIIAERYVSAQNKIKNTEYLLPEDRALRALLEGAELPEIKETLNPLVEALEVSIPEDKTTGFWEGIMEHLNHFCEGEKIDLNPQTGEFETVHIAYDLLFSEVVFWVEAVTQDIKKKKD